MKWPKRQAEINRLRLKLRGNRTPIPFPDLSTPPSPCSNTISGPTTKKAAIAGAKQFPIGHLHKQAPEMITPGMMKYLADFGGAKR